MPDPLSSDPNVLPPKAPVTRTPKRARFSPIWIIPIVSAVIGMWLMYRHYSAKGPEIVVSFENAEGVIAGKTPVLSRSVDVGSVSNVELSEDNKRVLVTISMTRTAARLLKEDTQIWIERPRFSAGSLSGLNTLVSGNYIQLQPGVSGKEKKEYVGLENPPATPPGVPGIRFKLLAEQAGGLGPSSPIIYKGIRIGRLESRVFRPDPGEIEYEAFIEGEYMSLVNQDTHFYNSGGLDLKIGAEGVQMRMGTLESLLTSSITFTERDPFNRHVKPIMDGQKFKLYPNLGDVKKEEFNPSIPYLLLFTGSVRGLNPDAPVEFRGIRVGSVVAASFKYLPDDPEKRVPVLIKLDPAILLGTNGAEPETAKRLISDSVQNGMRASLKTGSLLTGQLYVDLDFQKNAPPAIIAGAGDYAVLPTIPAASIEEIQARVAALLDKFQALPLEKIGENANQAIASVKDAAGNLNKLTGPESSFAKTLDNTNKLTGELANNQDISRTLRNLRETTAELNSTMADASPNLKRVSANLNQASDTVKKQPWRLIWPTTKKYPNEPDSPAALVKATPKPKPTPVRRKKT